MVRHVGVTNYDHIHLAELLHAGLPVSSNQVQYSVLDRRVEAQEKLCTQHEVRLLCYGVLAGGFLSDTWLGKADPVACHDASASLTTEQLAQCLSNRSLIKYYLMIQEFGGWCLFQELLAALRTVADRHATTIATLAQAWVLSRPCVGGVIVGLSGKDSHIDCARAAHDLAHDLEAVDYDCIDQIWNTRKGPQGVFYALERVRSGVHGSIMRYNCGELWTEQHVTEFERRVEWVVGLVGGVDGVGEVVDVGWRIQNMLLEASDFSMGGEWKARVGRCVEKLIYTQAEHREHVATQLC